MSTGGGKKAAPAKAKAEENASAASGAKDENFLSDKQDPSKGWPLFSY